MAEAIPLWPADQTIAPADMPTLTPHLIDEAEEGLGTVVVCPGGGYVNLANHEGTAIAEWLNANGINAAVLRYRRGPRHRHPAMIHDAQRAIRMVRDHQRTWKLANDKVAILGFSAGGHLASTAAVHFDTFVSDNDDLVGVHSARPDAAVLCYPVINMEGEFVHQGSRLHLLGPEPEEKLVDLLSTHRHVSPRTSPTFLWHTADDASVAVENSLQFAAACRRHRVPMELHVYESGRHGLGLAHDRPDVATWTQHCLAFLRRHLRAN